jgi:hypothetical protein
MGEEGRLWVKRGQGCPRKFHENQDLHLLVLYPPPVGTLFAREPPSRIFMSARFEEYACCCFMLSTGLLDTTLELEIKLHDFTS